MTVGAAIGRQALLLRVAPAEPADGQAWDRFVEAHPAANVSHLHGWCSVIEGTYGWPCYPLLLRRGEEIRGVLPMVWMKGRWAGSRLVSMPYLDGGGLIAESAADGSLLWRHAVDLARRLGARGIDVRGAVGPDVESPTSAPSRARWTVDLAETAEALWSRLSPKARNQIRKSVRLGLTTHPAEPTELDAFYRVFAHNMRDLGSPVHAREFFRRMLSVFASRARLYLTRDARGRTLAGALALRFGGCVTVPWASALRSSRPACPNHSLYWRILEDAIGDGARTFDFGRSTERSGSERFKRQWATVARPLPWRSFDGAGRPESERGVSAADHAVLVGLWRRLPLAVANRVGPRIRGHLAN